MRNPLRSQYDPPTEAEFPPEDMAIPEPNSSEAALDTPVQPRDNLAHLGHGAGRLLDLHDWFDEGESLSPANLDAVMESRTHTARDVRDDALQTVELLANAMQVRQVQIVGQIPVQLVDGNPFRRRLGISFTGSPTISIGDTQGTAAYYNGFIVPQGQILWLTAQSSVWACCPDNAATVIASLLIETRNGDRA